MRRAALAVCLAAVLVLALVASGCGSSKKSSTSQSSSATTKAEFLKRGNAICRKGNQDIGAAAHRVMPQGGKPDHATVMKFVKSTVIPSVQSQIQQLRALAPPPGDAAKVKALLDAAQAGLDKGKKNPALLASQGDGPFKKADQLANAYGLTACGSSS